MASEIAMKNIVFALCKYLSLDPNEFSSDLGSDVNSLYTRMLNSSGNGDLLFNSIESDLSSSDKAKLPHLLRWVDYIQSRHDGRPEDVLNPKKKQLDKITPSPHLFTDDKGVATFKNIPFTTSAGPCTSSIPIASIK